MNKYEIIIYWNETDKVFVAEIPELKGCIAHGDTHDDALKNVKTAAEEWLELATEKGWKVPEPKGKLIYA